MKAKRMLAIVAIAILILGFAFALAEAQTNVNLVKPDKTKTFVLGEGATQKIYCDSGQVGAYSVSAKSYNGGPGYSRIFSPPVYVSVYHSKDRKFWRWIDFVVVETSSSNSIEQGDEQKFFFSRKIDGFYRFELSHAFDSIPGSEAGKVSAIFKTFSWKSLVQDIDSATKLAPPFSAGIENPDGFSDLSSPQREEKMKLQDLGADYIDQAKKLSVILRIAAESISTNPARICYAKYLPSPYDEPNLDLIRYRNLFYVKALAGSAASFANSLQREPAFRAYSQDLAKAADELKKTTEKWQLEQKRQLPRQPARGGPPDKVFQEAAESMRKVAVCVEKTAESMKSNLVLAEGGQVRRFSPLLARELAVPVIKQSGENCGKTGFLMIFKYFFPDCGIDEFWLDRENSMPSDWYGKGLLARQNFTKYKEAWFVFLKEQITSDCPVDIPVEFGRLVVLYRPGSTGKYKPIKHAIVVTGFGSDGSVIFTTWGDRWICTKEKFQELWVREAWDYNSYGLFDGTLWLPVVQSQTSSVSTAKDDTLALEEK